LTEENKFIEEEKHLSVTEKNYLEAERNLVLLIHENQERIKNLSKINLDKYNPKRQVHSPGNNFFITGTVKNIMEEGVQAGTEGCKTDNRSYEIAKKSDKSLFHSRKDSKISKHQIMSIDKDTKNEDENLEMSEKYNNSKYEKTYMNNLPYPQKDSEKNLLNSTEKNLNLSLSKSNLKFDQTISKGETKFKRNQEESYEGLKENEENNETQRVYQNQEDNRISNRNYEDRSENDNDNENINVNPIEMEMENNEEQENQMSREENNEEYDKENEIENNNLKEGNYNGNTLENDNEDNRELDINQEGDMDCEQGDLDGENRILSQGDKEGVLHETSKNFLINLIY
jgi:hypothetical protein